MRRNILNFVKTVKECFSANGEYNVRTAPLSMGELSREAREILKAEKGRVAIPLSLDECKMIRQALQGHSTRLQGMIQENGIKRHQYQVSEQIVESWGRQAIAADSLAIELEPVILSGNRK